MRNFQDTFDRSNHQKCSIKKCVFKNFAKFTGKHICQSKNTFFYRTPPDDCFCFETLKRSFNSVFSIYMTVSLIEKASVFKKICNCSQLNVL